MPILTIRKATSNNQPSTLKTDQARSNYNPSLGKGCSCA